MTQLLKTTQSDLQQSVAFLQAGEVVAFPTETVYGLGADATNADAVDRVFQAKGRPSDNPLIVTVDQIEMVERFAVISEAARQLMAQYWPGPLTIILSLKAPGILPDHVTSGLTTAAFRLPDNAITRQLIAGLDRPLVGPSANLSGKPSPTTAEHVMHDMDGVIAAVVDDGPTQIGVESTVIDMSSDQPVILRPGMISAETLGVQTDTQLKGSQAPKAPGMKYRHYAPNVPVVAFHTADVQQVAAQLTPRSAIMALDTTLAQLKTLPTNYLSLGQDVNSASEKLFAGLRQFDQPDQIDQLFVEMMPDIEVGIAYNNRLGKASSGLTFGKE